MLIIDRINVIIITFICLWRFNAVLANIFEVNNHNDSCLLIKLHDTFGDGWGDASLLLETPDGNMISMSPTCSNNPRIETKCFVEDGIYFLTVASSNHRTVPKNWWEIYWTVTTWATSEKTYVGGYNTTMAFQFTFDFGWRLIYWDSLWSGEPKVYSCGGSSDYRVTEQCKAPVTTAPRVVGVKSSKDQRKRRSVPVVRERVIRGGGRFGRRGIGARKLYESASSAEFIKNSVETSSFRRSIGSVTHQSSDSSLTIPYSSQVLSRLLHIDNELQENHSHPNFTLHYHNMTTASSSSKHHIPLKLEDIKSKIHSNRMQREQVESTLSLQVVMSDPIGEGWQTDTYESVAFQISDDTRTKLLMYGSLAKGIYNGFCEFCFKDGSYYFRLTDDGNVSTDAEWSFCNTHGRASQELSFHISDSVCYPDVLVDLNEICHEQQYSLITIIGEFAIDGISSEIFSEKESAVIAQALSSVIYGWTAETIEVNLIKMNPYQLTTAFRMQGNEPSSEFDTSTSSYESATSQQADKSPTGSGSGSVVISESDLMRRSRQLKRFSYDLNFASSFVTELAYDIDGTNHNAVADLIEILETELMDVFECGALVASVKEIALSEGVSSLKDVSSLTFLGFDVEDITHVGSTSLRFFSSEEEYPDEESATVGVLDEDAKQEIVEETKEIIEEAQSESKWDPYNGASSSISSSSVTITEYNAINQTEDVVLTSTFDGQLEGGAIVVEEEPFSPTLFLAIVGLGVMSLLSLVGRAISSMKRQQGDHDLETGSEDSDDQPEYNDFGAVLPSEKEYSLPNFLRKELPEARKTVIL